MSEINILTVVTDWDGVVTQFMSPSLNDAALGIHELIAVSFLHETHVNKETTISDRVNIAMYKVEVVENQIVGTHVKIFEATLDFWPQRLQTVPLEILTEIKEEKKVVIQ